MSDNTFQLLSSNLSGALSLNSQTHLIDESIFTYLGIKNIIKEEHINELIAIADRYIYDTEENIEKFLNRKDIIVHKIKEVSRETYFSVNELQHVIHYAQQLPTYFQATESSDRFLTHAEYSYEPTFTPKVFSFCSDFSKLKFKSKSTFNLNELTEKILDDKIGIFDPNKKLILISFETTSLLFKEFKKVLFELSKGIQSYTDSLYYAIFDANPITRSYIASVTSYNPGIRSYGSFSVQSVPGPKGPVGDPGISGDFIGDILKTLIEKEIEKNKLAYIEQKFHIKKYFLYDLMHEYFSKVDSMFNFLNKTYYYPYYEYTFEPTILNEIKNSSAIPEELKAYISKTYNCRFNMDLISDFMLNFFTFVRLESLTIESLENALFNESIVKNNFYENYLRYEKISSQYNNKSSKE